MMSPNTNDLREMIAVNEKLNNYWVFVAFFFLLSLALHDPT